VKDNHDSAAAMPPEVPTAAGGELFSYRNRQWPRRALGAFLNLFVLPGAGTLLLGRIRAGWLQIGFALTGILIKIPAMAAIIKSAGGALKDGGWGTGVDQEALVLEISERLMQDPPAVFGVNAVLLLLLGVGLFLGAWISGAICAVLPPKSGWVNCLQGIRPVDHFSSASK
jgi:TM2 domain-containing membrane protein YozV